MIDAKLAKYLDEKLSEELATELKIGYSMVDEYHMDYDDTAVIDVLDVETMDEGIRQNNIILLIKEAVINTLDAMGLVLTDEAPINIAVAVLVALNTLENHEDPEEILSFMQGEDIRESVVKTVAYLTIYEEATIDNYIDSVTEELHSNIEDHLTGGLDSVDEAEGIEPYRTFLELFRSVSGDVGPTVDVEILDKIGMTYGLTPEDYYREVLTYIEEYSFNTELTASNHVAIACLYTDDINKIAINAINNATMYHANKDDMLSISNKIAQIATNIINKVSTDEEE